MTRHRRDLLTILMAVYVSTRLLSAFTAQTDSRLLAAIERYAPQPLPAVVCAPVYPESGAIEYYPTLYAVIPSMMVLPDTPCAEQLHW